MRSQVDPGRQGQVLVGAGLVLAITLLWGGIAWDLQHERREAMTAASRVGANLVRTIGAHFANIAQGIDHELILLRTEAGRRRAASGMPSLHPTHAELVIVDARGQGVSAQGSGAVQVTDAAVESWFRAHAERPLEDRLVIGNPVLDRQSGELRVHFSRPRLDRDGRFAGVIALAVPPWELNRIYEGIDLGEGGAVTLRRPDGTVLNRSRDFDRAMRVPPMALYDFAADGREVGEFVRTSPVDGIERLLSFRYLPQYNLGVVVGQPLFTVLEPVNASRATYILMGGAISVLLVLTAILAARSRGRMRDRAREARVSADRFRGLVELSADAYWELDHEFRFVSLEGGKVSGLSTRREFVLGRRVWEQDYVNMSAEDWARHRSVLEAHQPFRDVEVCRIDKEGQEYWLSISGEPVFDAAGTFTGYRGVSRDIRSIKSAQRRRELELGVSQALATSTGETDAVEAVLRTVCSRSEGTTILTYGEYWQVDPAANVLRLHTSWISPDASEATRAFHASSRLRTIQKGEGLVGRVWQSGETDWVFDAQRDSRLSGASSLRSSGLQGGALFPVKRDDGSVIGVMGFPTEHVRIPDQVMIDAMQLVGTRLGQYLQRKAGEQAVRESEGRFRSLVEISADTYWELDADFRFVYLEGGTPEWRAVRRPTMYGRTRWELDYVNLSEDEWQAHRELLKAHQPFRDLELCFFDQNGRESWIVVNGDPILDSTGKLLGYRGATKDITQRKRAELLRKIEHTVTRSLAAGDSESAVLEAVLRAFCEARIGQQFGEYWHIDASAELMQLRANWVAPNANVQVREFAGASRARVFRYGEGLIGEVWRTGEPLWVESAGDDSRTLRREEARHSGLQAGFLFPVISEGRTVGVMSFPSARALEPDRPLLDATRSIGLQVGQYLNRMQSERVLRASEARFRSLVEFSFETYWEQDASFRFTLVEGDAPEWRRAVWRSMLGHTRQELKNIEPVSTTWELHQANLYAHQPFRDIVFRRRDGQGREFWMSVSGEPVFDESGGFSGYRGVSKDITDARRAEQLRDLEHRVNRALASAEEGIQGVRAVLAAVCDVGRWECGGYWTQQSGELALREIWIAPAAREASRVFMEHSRAVRFAPGEGFIGHAVQTGEVAWLDDLETDARYKRRAIASEAGFHGLVVVPIRAQGRSIGAMDFPGVHASRPDEGLIEALRVVSNQLGQFLYRKESEQVLRESEERARSLLELTFENYWEMDTEFRFTKLEGGGPDWLRAAWPEMVGRARWELDGIVPASGDWSAHRADLEAHRAFRDLELRRQDPSGQEHWFAITGEPMFEQSGAFKGYRGAAKDITERKRTEQMRAIEHRVNRSLADVGNVSEALTAVLRDICEVMDWEYGEYWRMDRSAGILEMDAACVMPDADPGVHKFHERSKSMRIPLATGLVGTVCRTGEPLWINNLTKDERGTRREFAQEAGLRCVFLFPILAGTSAIGAMAFPGIRPRNPDRLLLDAVQVIGSQIGQYVVGRESERVLRDSEERFRSLTELSSDWYWEQDAQYRFTRIVGPAHLPIADMLGKTRWELRGTGLTAEEWRVHREILDAHKPFRDFINRFRGPDGTEVRTSINGQPIHAEDGAFVGYRGTARDVTESVRREEELVRFRTAMDASADLVFLVDAKTMRYIDVNDAACKRLGYSREELLLRGPADVYSQSREELAGTYRDMIAGDLRNATVEGELRCKDGSRLPVEAYRRVLKTPGGATIVAVTRDITARRRAEERARERDVQQGVIAGLGQRALVESDIQSLREHVTQEVRQALGTDFCSVFEMDREAGWFVLVAGSGYEPGWVGRRIIEVDSNSSPAMAVRTRESVMVEDFKSSSAPRGAELGRAHGVRSSIHTPILLGDGSAYGTMGVHSRKPRSFNDDQKTFLRSVTNILAAAIERGRAQERLARLAQFDTTTGLPNRSLFRDRLEQMLVQARRNRWNAGVMFVDLDRFKLVNDTLGHAFGDTLLVRVAERLSGVMRSGDTVGRLSGDEFAVALANIAHAEDAAVVAQKILDALSVPFELGGHKSYVTGSVGIAVYPSDGDDADTLLKNADTAMYRVKAAGRNAYQFYLPAMNERAEERFELESDLRGALDRGEFFLVFQPKVRLRDQKIVGFEALIRWRHAVRGVIDPELFIALLEDTGLIVPVGEWVIAEVCRRIQTWRAAGIEVPEIAVNLSGRQLQRRDLDEVVRRILTEHAVSPGLLGLEITESIMMQDTEVAVQTLRALREVGVRVYIDDFGTGYSSLSYLSSFPLDALKIDRSFIDGVVKGGDGAAIALAIINLAHSLRLEVIAEGVETREQFAFLRKNRCDTIQGYLFSPPVPPETCERALREGGRLEMTAKKARAHGRRAAS